jgi:hypothetical protein
MGTLQQFPAFQTLPGRLLVPPPSSSTIGPSIPDI